MAKESGLGARFFVAGVDLSGDVGQLGRIAMPIGVQPNTGIDKSAFERIHLTRDGALEYVAFWNPTGAHVLLSDLPTADQLSTYVHRPELGAEAANLVAKQIGYDGTRGTDGSLTLAVQALGNAYGLEWARMLTAGIVLDSGAGAQTGLDYGAAIGTTAFGLQAHLHVFGIGSGSATVAVQHSNDNGGGDPWANVTNGVFAAAAAVGSQRLQTTRTESIKRWLRVNVTGAFTLLDFAVSVEKNRAEVLF